MVRRANQDGPADPEAALALTDLRAAVAELRDALGGAPTDATLRLRSLEQRVARLEDLIAAGGVPAIPAATTTDDDASPPVQPEVPAPLAPLDRALEEDLRRTEKAETAARKIEGSGVLTDARRFLVRADHPLVGIVGDLERHDESTPSMVMLHVVEGGRDPDVSPSALFAEFSPRSARRVVVRDVHRSWFHRGVPGLGATAVEVAETIEGLLREHAARPLVVFGAGGAAGFGAILLGALLRADHVVALGPLTVLDRPQLEALDDDRWEADLDLLTARAELDGDTTDLLAVLQSTAEVAIDVHHGLRDAPERRHAERLRDVPGVTLYCHDDAPLFDAFLRSGQLKKLLRRSTVAATPDNT